MLDKDDSNQVMMDEASAFLRLGMPTKEEQKRRAEIARAKTFSTQGAGDGRLNDVSKLNAELECTPTVTIRKEMEDKGVTLPDVSALVTLSKTIYKAVSDYRYDEHKDSADGQTSMFNLFAELDKDGSRYITYDELETALRKKLKLKKRHNGGSMR